MTQTKRQYDQVLDLYAGGTRMSDIAVQANKSLSYVSKVVSRAREFGDERVALGDAQTKPQTMRAKTCEYRTCKELGIEVVYYRLSQYSNEVISLPRVSIQEKDPPS